MKQNTRWSALLVGMLITVIIIFVAIYLLDKIIPFSRDIKGVENGNIAYYQANTALNEALLSMSGGDPSYETGSSSVANGSGMIYKVTATGSVLPKPGQGNSEYDENWSILAAGKPIQLVLPSNINWNATTSTFLIFRVPDLNRNGAWTDQTLTGGTTLPIINWTLSASGETLQASGSQISANQINPLTKILFHPGSLNRFGKTLSGSSNTFYGFYNNINYCKGTQKCTLKFSLINPLLLTDNTTIAPYLEFQAHFNVPVPLQTAVVESEGYAGGFRKNITQFIQQMTTNEALDFTVFQ